MNKIKICCVMYKGLYDLTINAIKEIKEDYLEIKVIDYLIEDKNIEEVEDIIKEGFDIFVGGQYNSQKISELFDVPVLDIEVGYFDYLNLIFDLSSSHKRIAITSFRKPLEHNFDKISKLLGVNIDNIVYKCTRDLHKQIEASECTMFIGASLTNDIAPKFNKESKLIYPSEQAIVKEIYKAKNIALNLRKEKEKAQFTNAIFETSPTAIISTDRNGLIISANQACKKVLGYKPDKIRGKVLTELFDGIDLDRIVSNSLDVDREIVVINEKKMVLFYNKILQFNDVNQVIIMLTELSEINKAKIKYEEDKYKKYKDKGLIARYNVESILGKSKSISELKEEIKLYAKSSANVMIIGETGTGKEMVAQSIHNQSNRKKENFVAINCAAIPDNLLESELFGYVEGAFTGGKKDGKKGLFEIANGGTLFLDEIGEISHNVQVRLLRVIQEQQVMRLGDDKLIDIDVRVITATNKTEEDLLECGFRNDLLYRINVLQILVPSLRQRDLDCCILFKVFLNNKLDNYKLNRFITEEDLSILKHYSWPGNIRELQNVCERFSVILMNDKNRYSKNIKKLLIKCIGEKKYINSIISSYSEDFTNSDDKTKTKIIERIKDYTKLSNDEIAKHIGISRSTMWRLLNKNMKES